MTAPNPIEDFSRRAAPAEIDPDSRTALHQLSTAALARVPMEAWVDDLGKVLREIGPGRPEWQTSAGRTAVEDFLEYGVSLHSVQLTGAGFRALMATEAGSCLRRVVVGEILLQEIESRLPETSAQADIVRHLMDNVNRYQFELFTGEQWQPAPDWWHAALRQEQPFVMDLSERLIVLYERLHREFIDELADEEIRRSLEGTLHDWFGDVGHGFRELPLGFELKRDLDEALGVAEGLPVLLRPLTFMLVDDDIKLNGPLFHGGMGFSVFDRSRGPDNAIFHTVVRSGKEALEFLTSEEGLTGGNRRTVFPELLLVDIEMGAGMNGLETAVKLRELAKKAGEDPILIIWSSVIGRYLPQLDQLMADGVIQGVVRKDRHCMRSLIETVNRVVLEREMTPRLHPDWLGVLCLAEGAQPPLWPAIPIDDRTVRTATGARSFVMVETPAESASPSSASAAVIRNGLTGGRVAAGLSGDRLIIAVGLALEPREMLDAAMSLVSWVLGEPESCRPIADASWEKSAPSSAALHSASGALADTGGALVHFVERQLNFYLRSVGVLSKRA